MDTQTDREPLGYLSTVYPGPVPVALTRLGRGSQSGTPTTQLYPESSARSRVCEQVWFEGELFHQGDDLLIFATTEEDYRQIAQQMSPHTNAASLFGRLGEQLVLRNLQSELFHPGMQIQLADAVIQFKNCLTANITFPDAEPGIGQLPHVHIYSFRIEEPGIVEPGAALLKP